MFGAEDVDDARRRLLIKALTAGLFSFCSPVGNAFAGGVFGSRPKKLPAGQSVYRHSGKVTVNGKDATPETRIGPNDTIKTGKGSEIIFVVGGNSMILRENSEVTLQGNQESDSLVLTGMRMLTGKLLSVSRNQGMQVQSATATIGIRGTGFYLESDPDLTYFCTCYGLTSVASSFDPQSKDTVESLHHDKPLYILKDQQPGNNIRRAPFINHTDQELMLIETLVGRTPPFVFPGDEYSAPRRDY
jgi:hypothetical protein